ncbi:MULTISPECIES: hypothetical protein [Asaia]|uniref:Uncharacterized protein n=1 Tax=Asaia spathodeae TaxID=657016 RepID=A0ABX2P889_9PROT|nr:hypothetical protein [Asaia spathodeae]GBR20475.1 hypothetical protein AA105894_2566 [Asaia spathodeae NBRC 105894]
MTDVNYTTKPERLYTELALTLLSTLAGGVILLFLTLWSDLNFLDYMACSILAAGIGHSAHLAKKILKGGA